MRQVTIAKNDNIRDQVGTFLAFKLNTENLTVSQTGPTEVEFDLPQVNAGLVFRLPYPLALRGIVLLTTMVTDNKIRALYSTTSAASVLVSREVVLEAILVEEVKYVKLDVPHAHSGGVAMFYTESTATPGQKKRRKSNKA